MPGTDWVCECCHVQNTKLHTRCVVCGTERNRKAEKRKNRHPRPEKYPASDAVAVSPGGVAENTPVSAISRPAGLRNRPTFLLILYFLGILLFIHFFLQSLSGFTYHDYLNQIAQQVDFGTWTSRLQDFFSALWRNGLENLQHPHWERPFTLFYERCLEIPSWPQVTHSMTRSFNRFFLPLMLLWLISHGVRIRQDRALPPPHRIVWRCLRIWLPDFLLVGMLALVPANGGVSDILQCFRVMTSMQTVVLILAFLIALPVYGSSRRTNRREKTQYMLRYAFSMAFMYLSALFAL